MHFVVLLKEMMQPEGSAMVACVGHTSAAKFCRRRHDQRGNHQQTVFALVSAADADDEDDHHGNTTSTLTCHRCHGYQCQHCCLTDAEAHSQQQRFLIQGYKS